MSKKSGDHSSHSSHSSRSSSEKECHGCETGADHPHCHTDKCQRRAKTGKYRVRRRRSKSRSRSRSPKRSSSPKRRSGIGSDGERRPLSSGETLDGDDIACIGCETGADAVSAHCRRCNESRGFGTRKRKGKGRSKKMRKRRRGTNKRTNKKRKTKRR